MSDPDLGNQDEQPTLDPRDFAGMHSTMPPKALSTEAKLEIVIEAMHRQSQQLDHMLHGLKVVLEDSAATSRKAELIERIDDWLNVRRHDSVPNLVRLRAL